MLVLARRATPEIARNIPVQQRAFVGQLVHVCDIRTLFAALRWWERRGCWSLRTTPSPLSNEETLSDRSAVDFTRALVYDCLLGLDDCTWLALVVNAENPASELECLPLGRRWQRFQEFNLALAIDDSSGVELGYAWYRIRLLSCVKVYHFLCGLLEC